MALPASLCCSGDRGWCGGSPLRCLPGHAAHLPDEEEGRGKLHAGGAQASQCDIPEAWQAGGILRVGRRAQRASRSLPPRSKLFLLLYFIQSLSFSLSISLCFGSDCEFKKQNPQQLKEKTHLQHYEKSSAQSITEFRLSTAGLSAAGGTGQEANAKEPMPREPLTSAGRGGQAADGGWRSLGFSHQHNGLWDPDTFYQPWGAGGLVWIYLPFFFSLLKGGSFRSISLFLFFIFFLNGIGCFAGITLLPASVWREDVMLKYASNFEKSTRGWNTWCPGVCSWSGGKKN